MEGQPRRGAGGRRLLSLRSDLKVFVGIPSLRDNDAYTPLTARTVERAKDQDCPVEIMEPYVTPPYNGNFKVGEFSRLEAITDRLNNIVGKFMGTDATHLWILDGDIEAPRHALCKLLRLNTDVASGVYCFHNDPAIMMFGRMNFDKHKHRFIPRGLIGFSGEGAPDGVIGENITVGGGNGCLLIKRRVLTQFHNLIPPLRFENRDGFASDIWFWYRAQEMGFTCRIDGRVVCGHLNTDPKRSFPLEYFEKRE